MEWIEITRAEQELHEIWQDIRRGGSDNLIRICGEKIPKTSCEGRKNVSE